MANQLRMNLRSAWVHDGLWRWLTITALAINLASWFMMYQLSRISQTLTPLHTTVYFGPDLSFSPRRLFWLPGIGFVIWLLNLGWSVWEDQELWRRTWMLMTFVFVGLLLAVSGTLLYLAHSSV